MNSRDSSQVRLPVATVSFITLFIDSPGPFHYREAQKWEFPPVCDLRALTLDLSVDGDHFPTGLFYTYCFHFFFKFFVLMFPYLQASTPCELSVLEDRVPVNTIF